MFGRDWGGKNPAEALQPLQEVHEQLQKDLEELQLKGESFLKQLETVSKDLTAVQSHFINRHHELSQRDLRALAQTINDLQAKRVQLEHFLESLNAQAQEIVLAHKAIIPTTLLGGTGNIES